MIGGKVIEIIELHDRIWVNCQCQIHGDICAVFVQKTVHARCISEGDCLWWKADQCYWTPACNLNRMAILQCGKDIDIPIPKIGFSGMPRPELTPSPQDA